jgi:hypothetical protein
MCRKMIYFIIERVFDILNRDAVFVFLWKWEGLFIFFFASLGEECILISVTDFHGFSSVLVMFFSSI